MKNESAHPGAKFELGTAGYVMPDGSLTVLDEYHGEDKEYSNKGYLEYSNTHFEEDTCVRAYSPLTDKQCETVEGIIDAYLDSEGYCKIETWRNGKHDFYKVFSLYEGACQDPYGEELIGNWTGRKLVGVLKRHAGVIRESTLKESTVRLPNGVTMYYTQSPYEAKSICMNSRKGLRILYDPNIDMYAMGDVDRCVHWDLMQELAKDGWYAEQMKELEATNIFDFLERYVDFDDVQVTGVYMPDDCDSDTTAMDLTWDSYRYFEMYPDFLLAVRKPIAGTEFEDVFGKPIETKDLYANEALDEAYEPKKTGKAYKVFRVKDGKLYPPMVANAGGKDTPIGVWLDAEEGEFAGLSKTGRPQVKSTGSGTLSYRPGWHLGDLPRAPQFDRTNKDTGEREFPKDFVWAECDYAMDVDYQKDSDEQGYMRTKVGDDGKVVSYRSDKYQHSLAGLPKLPSKGYYRYRTNPNPETVPWVITGHMKVNRLLSDDEVNSILKNNGVEPIHRQGGDKTLKELGLKESLGEATHLKGDYDYDSIHRYLGTHYGFLGSRIPDGRAQLIDKKGLFLNMYSKEVGPLYHGEILQRMEDDGVLRTGDSLLDKLNLTETDMFQEVGFVRLNTGSGGYHYIALPDHPTGLQLDSLRKLLIDRYDTRKALIDVSGRGKFMKYMLNDPSYPIGGGNVDDLMSIIYAYADGRKLEGWKKALKPSLNEEWLDDEHGIWMTESQYEVANMMRNSDKSLRILWDRNVGVFYVCDADLYVHRDMIDAAVDAGVYGDRLKRWQVDGYVDDYGSNVVYYIYAPRGKEKETYGSEVSEDGYEGKFVYPFGTVTTRSDDVYKETPLAKALGKYEAHYVQDGWIDDYTPKVLKVESFTINEVYPNKGESKDDFISRFMSVTKDEYPDPKQRYAVALSYWDRGRKASREMLERYLAGDVGLRTKDGREYRIWTECTGSYDGQQDYVKLAFVGDNWLDENDRIIPGSVLGYVSYSVYEGKAHIGMVEVGEDNRRQGVATALIRSLVGEYGKDGVNWGYTTSDGTKLRKAMKSAGLAESALTEKKRSELIQKSKNSDDYAKGNQGKGRNRWERRRHSRIAASVRDYNQINMDAFWKGDILEFGIKVHGETDDYTVTVIFENILKGLRDEVKANGNKLEFKCVMRALVKAFNGEDVYVNCTCFDFRYRMGFHATMGRYNSGMPELRPSDITNPHDTKGAGCKHVNLVLSNADWLMKIASVINNYVRYCQKNMQRNYADYIFPKVYGMPYRKAVQLSLFDDMDAEDGGYLPSDQETIGLAMSKSLRNRGDEGRFSKGNEYRFEKTLRDRGQSEEDDEMLELRLGDGGAKRADVGLAEPGEDEGGR